MAAADGAPADPFRRTLVIVGPTAVGKTAVALALAERMPMEVISADSRQIYRKLDIATAKPSARERARLPHHGVDVANPGERYSAGRYAREATGWIDAVRARGREPVVVGGTGLYIRALTEGLFTEPPLDAALRRRLDAWAAGLEPIDLARWAARLDPSFHGGGRQRAARAVEIALLTGRPLSWWQSEARARAGVAPWYIVLTAPRPVLQQRIARRAEEMVRRGLIEEVAAVLAEHPAHGPGLDSIGVREAVEYLQGVRPRETVAEAIAISTRQYAKRQQTWFRHQLGPRVTAVDATRGPEKVAEEILRAWHDNNTKEKQ